MRPQAVFWDMDGTLVDSEPLHERSIDEALKSLGLRPPADLHARTLGLSSNAVFELVRDELSMPLPLEAWMERVFAHYLHAAPELRPRPGAIEILRALKGRGVPQAVVSNSDRMVVDANLRAVALAWPGMVTVSRNDVRRGKPDPEPYRRAAFLFGAEPERCVVVEDSHAGASAGVAAGMRTLFWPQLALAPPAGAEEVGSAEALAALLLGQTP